MHYLLDFPLWLQAAIQYMCVSVRGRFKLILAELGITIKFKQNIVLLLSFEPRRFQDL